MEVTPYLLGGSVAAGFNMEVANIVGEVPVFIWSKSKPNQRV